MFIKAQVLAEDTQTRDGVEYVTVTCMESGPKPLLQMFDYGLRADEKQHKGKLVGKLVELQVNTIRAIFSGRPQMSGHMELAK
ncbi:MAG TPA: hypothetical protein VGI03_11710 [Verrucomicrobiae bacterium]|jgi:hypothetical protein